MAVKSNRYFNDPAMAQAAGNLAALFEPPSGSDASGYAQAAATDLQTGQRKAIWDYIQRPDFDPTLYDRAGVVADLYNPDQSYYAVDTGAATTRRGQDITAGTTLTTNAADNARALAANAADNQRAMLQTLFGNLAPGDVRPEFTPEMAEILGLPTLPQQQGLEKPLTLTEQEAEYLRKLATGDTAGITDTDIVKQALVGTDVVPTVDEAGNVVNVPRYDARGTTSVLPEAEEKGLITRGLTPEQQIAAVLGTDVVQMVDDQGNITYQPRYDVAGKTPVPGTAPTTDTFQRKDGSTFVGYADAQGQIHNQATRALEPDAVRKGEPSASAANLQVDDYIAIGPDDKEMRFVGYFDPADRKIHDQDTGAVVPNVVQKGIGTAGLSITTNPDGTVSITQGGPGGTKPPTEGQIRTGYAEEMSAEPTKEILKAFDTGKLPTMADYVIFRGLERLPPEGVALATQQMTPEGQLFYQNLRSALPMQALIKSGIAVNETERLQLLLELVPLPGEAPEATKAKRRQFETFTRAAHRAAGPAALPQATTQPPAATTETPSPAETAPPQAAAPAAPAVDDRAASIANAKAAVASGDYTKQEAIDWLKQNGVAVTPGELD